MCVRHSVEKAVMQCETYAVHLLRMLTEGPGSDVSMRRVCACNVQTALDRKNVEFLLFKFCHLCGTKNCLRMCQLNRAPTVLIHDGAYLGVSHSTSRQSRTVSTNDVLTNTSFSLVARK